MKTTLRILSLVLALLMMVPAVLAEEAPVEEPAAEEPAITLPAPEQCELCGEEHIILPCGLHPGCGEEITEGVYASHQSAPCGDHALCEIAGDMEKHETRGTHCGQYMCHNIDATYHTRCRHCGGSLCQNRHGRDICYDFGYKFESMYIPAPEVAPKATDNSGTQPTTTTTTEHPWG